MQLHNIYSLRLCWSPFEPPALPVHGGSRLWFGSFPWSVSALFKDLLCAKMLKYICSHLCFPSFTLVSVSNGCQSTCVHMPENSSLLLPFFRITPARWRGGQGERGEKKEDSYLGQNSGMEHGEKAVWLFRWKLPCANV